MKRVEPTRPTDWILVGRAGPARRRVWVDSFGGALGERALP